MGWLILVALFLLTAFVTYGLFANVADARRETEQAENGVALAGATGRGRLSTRLGLELSALEAGGVSAKEWLSGARVPYGYCVSKDACDTTVRCVQCGSFETTRDDLPALQQLLDQEMDLAETAERRGLAREAEIHRNIATGIRKHVDAFARTARNGVA